MDTIVVKRGGYGYNLRFTVTVKDDAGAIINLTGYTVRFHVWDQYTPGVVLWTLVGTIVVAANGTVDMAVTAADFITVGVYLGELELTKAGKVEPGESFVVVVKENP